MRDTVDHAVTDAVPNIRPRKLHVMTWGCQMNVYDSARMGDVLAPLGFSATERPEDADMVILNTCHIRDRAAEKVFSELGRLRDMKMARRKDGLDQIIAVAGCVAQAEGAEIVRRAPYVDIVLGPQTYHRLPEMVAQIARSAGIVIDTDFPAEQKFDFLPEEAAPQGVSAFLTIQEGCDKFCSFCVVPYTRGAESSRPAASVIAEARRMVKGGAREITLLGQNVNAWRGEAPDGGEWRFAQLLHALADIPDLIRLRYTTSHPNDMDDDLIAAHGALPQLMPYLHLPVQSGSDRMLRAMNRKHTIAEYIALIERMRAVQPDLVLSSDFIVGHPGETDADHEATMELIRKVGFVMAYSFKYSSRPGTPAATRTDHVPEAVKDARLKAMQALLREQQLAYQDSMVGKRFDILLTGPGKREGQMVGRSPSLHPVHVQCPASWAGRVERVLITAAHSNSLFATLESPFIEREIASA